MNFGNQVIAAKCPDCEIQFSSFEAFHLHYVEQHKRIKLEPDHVHNIYPSSDFLKWIKRRSIKKRLCDKSVKPELDDDSRTTCQSSCSSNSVKRHRNKKKSLEVKVLPCQSCSYVAKSELLLQKHIQTQHNPQRKIFSCNFCDYSCLQERTFNLHKLKHSEQEAKFACDQCGKLFVSMGIMKRHALTHNKLKSFVCDMEGCGKVFNIKSRLTDHIRKVHVKSKARRKSQDQSNACLKDSIERSTSSKDSQERKEKILPRQSGRYSKVQKNKKSLASYNDNEEQFLPPKIENENNEQAEPDVINVYDIILSNIKCDKNGANKIWNNRVPNDETSSSVSTCSSAIQAFSTNYANHFAGQNNRISKFTCSWIGCRKTFRDGYNLRMHICTHTGEMQRACKLCGYTCVQKSALDKHLKVHLKDVKHGQMDV